MVDETNDDWALVNEFGGSQCLVDRRSIEHLGNKVRARVIYRLNPPGTDQRNQKPIGAMLNIEEYDLDQAMFRVHRVVFLYLDGTESAPLKIDPSWRPARDGNGKTLEFLRRSN